MCPLLFPYILKLVVAAGARSVPERSGCDGETGLDDFMRLARLATAAGGDRPRAANNSGMLQLSLPPTGKQLAPVDVWCYLRSIECVSTTPSMQAYAAGRRAARVRRFAASRKAELLTV